MSVSHQPTLTDQQRFWDGKWRKEIKVYPNEWAVKRGETILAFLRSLPLDHPKILDLGCGIGWFAKQLAQLGEVTGVDLSEEAIAVAKSRYPEVKFLAGNLFELPLPAGHFDVVVAQEVIAHVEDQVGFLHRIAQLVKPGGYLVLTSPNKFVLDRARDIFPYGIPGHIEQWLDMKKLKYLVRTCFHVRRTKTILPMGDRGILRLVNSHKLNNLVGLVVPRKYLDALKERAGIGYTMIVLAQKRVLNS